MKFPDRLPLLPALLLRRHTDEFSPPPYTARERLAVARVAAEGPHSAARLGMSLADYWSARTGTAAGLLALNESAADRFYDVPSEAAEDR